MGKTIIIVFFLGLLSIFQCESTEYDEHNAKTKSTKYKFTNTKINGVSFVSPHEKFSAELMKIPNQKIAASWLCFMPFGFVQSESNQVQFNSKWQWWGERTDGVFNMIQMAQQQDYQIMLKPQIWIKHGEYTGHLSYTNETDWKAFEESYSKFILTFAHMADSLQTELFCIGTELEQFVKNRPDYWHELIHEIRKVYSGKITYAANWDEYTNTPFWKDLDFIGIDGYFPLSELKSPSMTEIRKSWAPHKIQMKHFADSIRSPILFTEYGYRSRDFSTHKPWESDRGGKINLELQSKAYEAIFKEIWKESYFAGGFLWKWFPDYNNVGGPDNMGFTPQRKPAETVIKRYYGLDSSN